MKQVKEEKREGYKLTKVGWIPEDWDVKIMRELFAIKHGFAFKSDFFSSEGKYIVTTPGHFFEDGGFRKREGIEKKYIGDFPREYILKYHDLVIAMTEQGAGLLGSTAIIPTSDTYLHNQRIGLVNGVREDLHPNYLYYFLNRKETRQLISQSAAGTKVKHSSPDKILSLSIPIPSIPEQKAIAKVLTSWDEGIQKLEQLIEQKTLKKQALMQQLLTGRKRLPGFVFEQEYTQTKLGLLPDDWKLRKAGELFRSVSIKNNDNEELLAVTQDRGAIPRSMLEGRVMSPDGSTNGYKLVVPGNFIISLRSFQGGLEYSDYRGLVSPAYTVLEPRVDLDKSFFRYFFKSQEFISRLAVAVIGIRDGKQISFGDFSHLYFRFPPLEEQQKIATILNTSTKEIDLLKQKLAAMKEQKKGLMQQLLTGKKRLKME